MGRDRLIFTSNKLNITFRALNHCARFHQNQIQTAAVKPHADTSNFIT